ncbi:MAG: Lrp/AsnC family transcriptional regulator [Candidatus Heimdallarchaeota archaeon]|nr:Lrp/AsnC family transcriptional regulator [Candidatus Heimdallarchaeota archaeon]
MVRISDTKTKSSKITDHEIIRILLQNSRRSFVDIAKELNVTETAIRKRVRRMEKQGTIERYSIDVNPKNIGLGMRVLLGIDTTPQTYISTLQKLKNIDEILRVYSSSGDHMIMLECWMKDDADLDNFINELKNFEGIVDICPSIIKEIIK